MNDMMKKIVEEKGWKEGNRNNRTEIELYWPCTLANTLVLLVE